MAAQAGRSRGSLRMEAGKAAGSPRGAGGGAGPSTSPSGDTFGEEGSCCLRGLHLNTPGYKGQCWWQS